MNGNIAPVDNHTWGVVHLVIACFSGLNALLVTYLTLRARAKDKKEAERNGGNGDSKHSA